MNKSHPIRMCIICRVRYPQGELLRFKQYEKTIIEYDGIGRSVYLCYKCIENEKKIKGLMKRFNHKEERFIKLLKESMKDG